MSGADRRDDPGALANATQTLVVPSEAEGARLDMFLAHRLPQYSRTLLARSVNAGRVTIDGETARSSYRVRAGQRVDINLPDVRRNAPEPEEIPLDVLFEDEFLIVLNKPAGRVVHPAKGNWSGTLVAALAFHFKSLSRCAGEARPGIVHRLDRDTSGVLVVAKNDVAHQALAAQFEERSVLKEYVAVVRGVPDRDRDVIDQPIGVHPYQREKMAIRPLHPHSRPARTVYEVQRRFDGFAQLRVHPKSGRTHQIRVHLAHIRCAIVCDRLYSGHAVITRGELRRRPDDTHVLLARQALHAHRLQLRHPHTGRPIWFEAPLPSDIQALLDELHQYRRITP
jgi:23S rRNA pseudouridine1911/1915/1917 synthase